MLIQDYLDICDLVLTFDRFMGGIPPLHESSFIPDPLYQIQA